MNRTLLLTFPLLAASCTFAQTPAAQSNTTTASPTETGKIARFVGGPDGKLRGFLLQNGTFVMLPPGLGQQLPSNVKKDTSVSVTGNSLSYNTDKTIEAQSLTIAGIRYKDAPPVAPVGTPPPPPPVPAAGGIGGRPAGPPPPPPCVAANPTPAPAPAQNQ